MMDPNKNESLMDLNAYEALADPSAVEALMDPNENKHVMGGSKWRGINLLITLCHQMHLVYT